MSDLDGRAFIKRGNALIPADFAADEAVAAIAEGREVLVTIRRPRSVIHHRWFFSLLRHVVSNSEQWSDEDDLLDDLKLATGHITRRVNLMTGEVSAVAKSINFASMPEDAFRRFKDRCLFVLAKVLGIDPVTLMEETDATQRPTSVASPPTSPARTREREPA